jgi:hypothetical protein
MTAEQAALVALQLVYLDAVRRKEYRVCDQIRQEIQRLMTGKSLRIPCEDSLNLDASKLLS